jgi:hypothetical protein
MYRLRRRIDRISKCAEAYRLDPNALLVCIGCRFGLRDAPAGGTARTRVVQELASHKKAPLAVTPKNCEAAASCPSVYASKSHCAGQVIFPTVELL